MFQLFKLIFFLFTVFGFGFLSISQLLKLSSLITLIPLSASVGLSVYLFLCHTLSYLIGPQLSSILSIFILFLSSILILLVKQKKLSKIQTEISILNIILLYSTAILISILTYLAIFRSGTIDREFHIPLAATIFHNNVYPPRDFSQPDHIMVYHLGGDLLAGAISNFSGINISDSFELISSFFAGIIFLGYCALSWLITKNFKISLLASFCSYFGGGLLWLDSIVRFLISNQEDTNKFSFFESFINYGIHGSITNPPSISVFISTFALGYSILITSIILLKEISDNTSSNLNLAYGISLIVSLFALFISAEWLYYTFLAGVIPFLLVTLINKKKKAFIYSMIAIVISILLIKTIGNPLFLQNEIQNLERVDLLGIVFKENPLWIEAWGRFSALRTTHESVFIFSWDFLSEFGFSLILFPIILFYLLKTKKSLAILLFFISITTMPLPLFFELKSNPVDFNRLFSFGNSLLILLITCGICELFKSFIKNKSLIFIYLTVFCLSPLAGLMSGILFSPYYLDKRFSNIVFKVLNQVNSFDDFKLFYSQLNLFISSLKYDFFYRDEIVFLQEHSNPLDVAISNIPDIPSSAGIYTIIPPEIRLYKDQLYSPSDDTFQKAITTLDTELLNSLNIKWIVISNKFKDILPPETQKLLNNSEKFNLAYKSQRENSQGELFYIFHVENAD